MRIIAGKYGSRRLKAPESMDTRPTADRVKEALFSMLGGDLTGETVLDLYAGSGALALEAISRGAESAVMVDQSKAACRVIAGNIATLGCEKEARLLPMSDEMALALLTREGARFSIIFLDPPYRMDAAPVTQRLLHAGLLSSGGVLVIEHSVKTPPLVEERLTLSVRRAYGDTALSLYHLNEEDANGQRTMPLSGQL